MILVVAVEVTRVELVYPVSREVHGRHGVSAEVVVARFPKIGDCYHGRHGASAEVVMARFRKSISQIFKDADEDREGP